MYCQKKTMRYEKEKRNDGGNTRRTGTPRKNEKLQSLFSKWLSRALVGLTTTLRHNGSNTIQLKNKPLPLTKGGEKNKNINIVQIWKQ